MEKEKLLLLANLAVIALGGLFQIFKVFGHHLLLWKGDAIYALKGVVVGVAKEVRGTVLPRCQPAYTLCPGHRFDEITFITLKNFTRPVCGTWGPRP